MDGILGMMEEKGFKEDDWRDREKWWRRITEEIQMDTGRCENVI